MDHHKISKELCSFELSQLVDGRTVKIKPGVNTIAKAYDRTTTNEADDCNVLDETIYTEPVLTKAAGELFFFDEISYHIIDKGINVFPFDFIFNNFSFHIIHNPI